MRAFIRKITPSFILKKFRDFKRNKQRKQLLKQKESGTTHTKESLLKQLKENGILKGDTVLVHSALSKIGYVEEGPKAVVEALKEAVGSTGHLLMPTSPNAGYQLEYIKELSCFDVANAPSKLGAITEVFRKDPDAIRSWHPTEPVSCIGPNANFFVSGHFGEPTPYTKNSPFARVAQKQGKILMIGVTLDNAGTNLHVLEDAIPDFKFPVYYPEVFEVTIKAPDGSMHKMQTKVHDPEWSKKRKCDQLIPLFEKQGALRHITIGNAPTLLIDAEKMLTVMLKSYNKNGVTMYTPLGSD